MGFNPTIRTERTIVDDDKRWMRSRKGWDTCQSIMLDMSTFTGPIFADGAGAVEGAVLHSGVPLGLITASGHYGPYENDALDGRQVFAGYLFNAVQASDEDFSAADDVAAALLWEGEVIQDRTPVNGVGADNDPGFLDDAQRDAYGPIRFLQSSDIDEQGDAAMGFSV